MSQPGLECKIDDAFELAWEAPALALTTQDSEPNEHAPLPDGRTVVRRSRVAACPAWKRTIDIVGATVGLLFFAPLFVAMAAYIKIVSRGPVFFRHERYGVGGRPFRVWKFRTMEACDTNECHRSHVAELMKGNLPLTKRDDEAVMIRGGALLRRLGLDELPQLFNVLSGEMSLVGPRPDVIPPHEYAWWQRRRFDVLPGISGLWQVCGKNETTFATMMRMDVLYVRRRGFWLDVWILLRTIPSIMSSDSPPGSN